ncbi:VOC family protein [Kutzneria sp. NPDC051319]|uniref:VOC family protein n=1 Tax=Kutzneria sp. NPDC051319 TaxID=3155047 RepID=UPI0034291BC5
MPRLRGIHHVKFPVSDLAVSRAWYEKVFGFEATLEFPDEDGVVRGVAGTAKGLGESFLGLRENPDAAAGFRGFDPVGFGVEDRAAAEEWASHLDRLGIEHSPVIDATIGWILVFHDPDGTQIRLCSFAEHGIDQTGRKGYGRTADA